MRQEKIYPVSKECIVINSSGQRLAFDPVRNLVYVHPKGIYNTFPSKTKAQSAVHRTVELEIDEGKEEPWKDYEIVEI